MTEDDAQNWLAEHFDVSRETWSKLEAFIEFLKAEAQQQVPGTQQPQDDPVAPPEGRQYHRHGGGEQAHERHQ